MVFVLAFAHTSLLVGALQRLPLGGPAYEAHLRQTRGPLVGYPLTVYGFVGRLAWGSGGMDWVYGKIYSPIVKSASGQKGLEQALQVMDISLWNTVTLASLALAVLLFLIPTKKKRSSRLY